MRGAMRIVGYMAAGMVAIVLVAGCGAPESTTPAETGGQASQAEAGEAAGKYVFGMSQCNLGEPWRVQMNADIEAAAAGHPNVEVVFRDAQNDTLKQVAHVEEFMSQGVDVLIISPKEAAPLTDPIAKAYQAGIPVVVLDRAVLKDQFTMFIGADNKLIGEAAGRWVAQKLNGQGNVVELKGLMTSIPGHDRHNGFRKGIAGTDINVVFEADMQWLQPKAQQEMESALARFEDIDLVYGHNDPAAYGAYLAAKAADRADEMYFVGIDGLPHEGLAYVEQGILDACFEYPTGGQEAIEYGLKIVRGEEVPKHVTVPSRYFTPENLEEGGAWLKSPEDVQADAPAESGVEQ